MKNEWIVIEIEAPGALTDLIGAVAADYNCCGLVVEERLLDTFVVPDDELDPGKTYCLKIYFEDVDRPAQLFDEFSAAILAMPVAKDNAVQLRLGEAVQIEDWSEQWKQNFSAFRVGQHLVIRPSWENIETGADDVMIEIDPGMAFGTGTHATTKLCLEVIADLMATGDMPESMLDVGTGSGLLALGAAALGCPRILANDIDPVACDVAVKNINHNGLQDRIEVTDAPLEALSGTFDLVVANILAEENVRLAQHFIDHLNPGGTLVLSGILREKEQFVRDGFAATSLIFDDCRYQEEWICLVYRRSSNA